MTDSSGQVVWAADYKPFGEATVTVSTITNNLRFPGQYFDQETGLNYNYYRDYNPMIGRYIEADPVGIDGAQTNLFLYVLNNPLRYIDVFGLKPSCFCTFCNNAVGANVLRELQKAGIDGGKDETGGNAFRHCLATCQAVKACGAECAKDFWDGRENPKSPAGQQDLANNQIGYGLASGNSCWASCKQAWRDRKLTCKGKPCPPPAIASPNPPSDDDPLLLP